jgi:hypothetical protein
MSDERVSLIQGVINEMDQAAAHKQQAINLLDNLKAWLTDSLERDYGFRARMLRAITVEEGTTLMDNDIKNIASSFGAGSEPK